MEIISVSTHAITLMGVISVPVSTGMSWMRMDKTAVVSKSHGTQWEYVLQHLPKF